MFRGSSLSASMEILRSVARALVRRNRGTSLWIIALLSVGIGVNVGLFSIAYSALMRPLPFRDADRLVWVDEFNPGLGAARGVDWPLYEASLQDGFPLEIALFRTTVGATDSDGVRFEQAWVTGNLPRVLQPDGAPPSSEWIDPGRGIYFRDQQAMDRLTADLVGDTILVDSESRGVLGIAPWTIEPLASVDAFGLLTRVRVLAQTRVYGARGESDSDAFHIFLAVGKLAPGTSLEQAERTLNRDRRGGWRVRAAPLRHHLVGEASRKTLRLLQLLVLMALVAACASISGLLLAATQSRRREMAIRLALGASRRRLRSEVFAESVLLSLGAGVLGLAVSAAVVSIGQAASPVRVYGWDRAEINLPVLGFALMISLLTGLAAGFWPTWRTGRDNLSSVLIQGGTITASSRPTEWIVFLQTALSAALLVASLTTLASFAALTGVQLGFEPEEALAVRLSAPAEPTELEGKALHFLPNLIQDLQSVPGVVSVSAAQQLPFADFTVSAPVSPLPPEAAQLFGKMRAQAPYALVSRVAPQYFKAMGIPILDGSDIDWRHTLETPDIAVVSKSIAERLFGAESPVGKGFSLGLGKSLWLEVVGVAGDIIQLGPQVGTLDQIYVPMLQSRFLYMDIRKASFEVIIRTEGSPRDFSSAVRARIEAEPWNLKIEAIRTVAQYLDRPYRAPRFVAGLTGFFAALSVMLALAGVFGLAAREALRREREMALRSALGASGGHLAGLFVRRTASWLAPALMAGNLGAWLLTRGLGAYLFQVSPSDPAFYVAANLSLGAAALVIGIIPIRNWRRRNLILLLNTGC